MCIRDRAGVLFDAKTAGAPCTQPPTPAINAKEQGPMCFHTFGLWQVWSAPANASHVLLGELSKYVPLSGYRFRLPAASAGAGADYVVVGMPGEVVEVTYLVRKEGGRGAGWTVATASTTVGSDGRAELRLGR